MPQWKQKLFSIPGSFSLKWKKRNATKSWSMKQTVTKEDILNYFHKCPKQFKLSKMCYPVEPEYFSFIKAFLKFAIKFQNNYLFFSGNKWCCCDICPENFTVFTQPNLSIVSILVFFPFSWFYKQKIK